MDKVKESIFPKDGLTLKILTRNNNLSLHLHFSSLERG